MTSLFVHKRVVYRMMRHKNSNKKIGKTSTDDSACDPAIEMMTRTIR